MIVLSLFDGMSCGRVALERAGVKVDRYYASEVDKYAQIVSEKNYPDIIRLGDFNGWLEWDLPKIDLIIAGSPCQGFSRSGKGLNFNDPRSKLFFVFVEIMNHLKTKNPNLLFMLENVKMRQDWEAIITREMGIAPIEINSALVSAQSRERLYWTNIGATRDMFGFAVPAIEQPKDKGIILADIIESGITKRKKSQTVLSTIHKENPKSMIKRQKLGLVVRGAAKRNQITKRGVESQLNIRKDQKSNAVVSSYPEKLNCLIIEDSNMSEFQLTKGETKYIKSKLEFLSKKNYINFGDKDKAKTLTANTMQSWDFQLIPQGLEKPLIMQRGRGKNKGGIKAKDGKTPALTGSRFESNNMVLAVLAADVNDREINRRIYSEHGKAPTLRIMGGGNQQPKVATAESDGFWFNGVNYRKITPLECERLQTLPDNYTKGVSNSQRYKMLGNGWTVDVIAHIFSYLPKEFKESK